MWVEVFYTSSRTGWESLSLTLSLLSAKSKKSCGEIWRRHTRQQSHRWKEAGSFNHMEKATHQIAKLCNSLEKSIYSAKLLRFGGCFITSTINHPQITNFPLRVLLLTLLMLYLSVRFGSLRSILCWSLREFSKVYYWAQKKHLK